MSNERDIINLESRQNDLQYDLRMLQDQVQRIQAKVDRMIKLIEEDNARFGP